MADDSAAAATAMPQAFEELEIPALDVSRAPGALDSNAGPAAGSAIQSPDAAAGAAAMGSAVGSATGAAGGEGGNSSSSGNKPRDPVSVALFHARRAPPTKKSLFVSELHEDTEFTALQRDFEPFGEIISVRVLRDAKSGKSRRIGYINFADAVAADAALHAKNGQPGPHGAPYVLTFADNDPSFTPQPTTKLFIRFIPQHITEAEVRQAFEPFGVVVDVSVALDTCRAAKKEPLPWNMAYVTFDKASDATAAIAKTDRQFLFGDLHHLVVKAAEDPETKKKRQEWRQQAQAALAPEKEKTPTNAANQQQQQSQQQQQQQQQQQSQKAGVGRSPKNADGANGARRDMSRNETFGRNLPAAVRAGPSMMPSQPMQYVAAAPPQAFVHLPPSPVNAQQVQQLSPHSQQQQQQRNGWVTLSPHGTQQPVPQQQQPQQQQQQQQVFWQQQQQQQPPQQQHQGGYGGGQFGGAATNNNAVRPTNFFVQQPQQHNAVQNAEVPWLQPQHQQQQQQHQQQPQQPFYAFGGQQPPRVGDGGHHVHLPYPLLQGGRSSRPPQQEGLWGPLGAGDQQQQGRQQQGGSNGTLNSLPTFGGGGGDAGWGAPAAPEPLSGSGLFNVSTVAQTTTHTTAPPSAQANPMSAHMHAAGHPSSGHAGVSAVDNDAPPQLFMRAADGSFVPYTPAAQSSATRQQHGRGQ